MNEMKIQLRWNLPVWFIGFFTSFLPDNRYSIKIRGTLMRPFIKRCGKNFQLGGGVTLLNTYNLEIGDNVYIARGTWINSMGGLRIEDEVVIAPYVIISTMQHQFKNYSVRFAPSIKGEVLIGKGSWIAGHASIKCGVKVGQGNLIAANSFVASDTDDNYIYGGVPAKKIKKLENMEDDSESFYSRSEILKMKNSKKV